MTKKEFKYLANIAVLFICVLIYFGIKIFPHKDHIQALQADSPDIYVLKAIDGDTLKLSSGEHVRLIGIDTPESRYNAKLERDSARSRKDLKTITSMGKKAANFTRDLTQGKKIRFEYDVQKRDKYDRLLVYAYLEDGTFVNAKIIEEGYAQAMTIPPNVKYADTFIKMQKDAREKRKGLWNEVDTSTLF